MNTHPTHIPAEDHPAPGIDPAPLTSRCMSRMLSAMHQASDEQKAEDRFVEQLKRLYPANMPSVLAQQLRTAMCTAAEQHGAQDGQHGSLADLLRNPWFVPVSFAAACVLFFAFNMAMVPDTDTSPVACAADDTADGATTPVHRNNYIGLAADAIPDVLRTYSKLNPGEGIYVREVSPDSPAAKAGIRPVDIVLAIDGQTVSNADDINRLINSKNCGESVRVALVRSGQRTDVNITLEEAMNNERSISLPGADPHSMLAGASSVAQQIAQQATAPIPANLYVRDVIRRSGGAILAEFEQGAVALNPSTIIRNLETIKHLSPRQDGDSWNGIASVRFEDNQGAIVVSAEKNRLTIETFDQHGNSSFKGSMDTPEARQALPQQLFVRMKGMAMRDDDRASPDRL